MPISLICPDASFVIPLLVPEASSEQVHAQWSVFLRDRADLLAPALLFSEVTNVLHQHLRRGWLTRADLRIAHEILLSLPIRTYTSEALPRRAVTIAQEYELPASYDAEYLATADLSGAELWTLDQRLHRAVHEKMPWVRLLVPAA